MKKVIIIITFIIFLKPIFPVIDYVVNYDYISKELCENKAKPELKCNGKCQLMKELAKASEDEKPINSDKKENSKHEIEVLFFQEIKTLTIRQIYFHNKTFVRDNYANLYFHMVSCSVFHPPTFIA
ncbi:MAG TPA: hypothetical protein VK164_12130 [Flavobacterium sp.]|uniref:hypothetical protein n=1 Tax=Flavobacterium sp. TaxID=239 RepID=UPI002B4B45AD|nr:hypothetical protein [Flavobacterium sp.]HLO74678.1 hypothetical protein [Flavobacterium sp.]